MQTNWLRQAAVVMLSAGACVGAGAFAAQAGSNGPAELPGKPGCFLVRNVQDWTVIDDSTLIVHAPLKQNAYLVKLFRPVQALDVYLQLGFQDVERTGRICDSSRDYLFVRDYTPSKIPIVAVRELTMPEQALLLAGADKGAAPRSGLR
jgi:hypothetical protein